MHVNALGIAALSASDQHRRVLAQALYHEVVPASAKNVGWGGVLAAVFVDRVYQRLLLRYIWPCWGQIKCNVLCDMLSVFK